MPCRHRFQEILIPQQAGLQFIFIGTFNPEWNADNENNADYFYGRGTNLFWCIMPHAFGKNCLIDKGISDWKSFCEQETHKIGLTDLIICISNADKNVPEHMKAITKGFDDTKLDEKKDGSYIFNLDFNTEKIKELITLHQKTLKGVFFTRSSIDKIERIWSHWSQIDKHCKILNKQLVANIHTAALLTPSPRGRGSSIRKKIEQWKIEIQKCG